MQEQLPRACRTMSGIDLFSASLTNRLSRAVLDVGLSKSFQARKIHGSVPGKYFVDAPLAEPRIHYRAVAGGSPKHCWAALKHAKFNIFLTKNARWEEAG
jgi:hypothetical protein